MRLLEHKVPPPLVALVLAALMWAVAASGPGLGIPGIVRAPLALVVALTGIAFDLLGVIAFRRSRTTINPLRPGNASALVTGGVYRITRNPMYLGMALLLIAWTLHLDAALALLGPVLFVTWITRLQIIPEERVMRAKFAEFETYASRVRRWL